MLHLDYPTLICPLNITVETEPGEPFATVSWSEPTRSDTADTGRIPDPDRPPGNFHLGTTDVTYDFDIDGFEFDCTFSVTVEGKSIFKALTFKLTFLIHRLQCMHP